MTPQERQMLDELFDRLASLENAPRDPEAVGAINEGLQRAPNALYPLVQTVLVQDEALKRADARIRELEGELGIAPEKPPQQGELPRQHARRHARPARTRKARCRRCVRRQPPIARATVWVAPGDRPQQAMPPQRLPRAGASAQAAIRAAGRRRAARSSAPRRRPPPA